MNPYLGAACGAPVCARPEGRRSRALVASSSRVARGALALAAALLAPLGASSAHAAELLSHGYFDNVQVTRPAGEPRNFVMSLKADF